MSAIGTLQTSMAVLSMSAKADIPDLHSNVR